MPQEKLKPSFEQAPVDNITEKLSSTENLTKSSIVEAAPAIDETIITTTVVPQPLVKQPARQLTPRQAAIDDVLEDGLADIYINLSPAKQQELKQAGERTVHQIDQLLGHAKTQLSKIIGLIRRFLLIIPGVNRFFLEQEIKIKTDKIMALKDK